MGEVDGHPVKMIGKIRAARAALFPAGTEHEVIDDELATAFEQFGERLFAARAVEYVVLVNLDPGQFAPPPAQLVAGAGELLLGDEMRLARSKPFVLRDDLVRCEVHDTLLRLEAHWAGVIQPTPAPPGSVRTAIRPTWG